MVRTIHDDLLNTMKAYTNGSIPHQYFFDMNYFQLLMDLYIQQLDLKPTFWDFFIWEDENNWLLKLFEKL